MHGATCGEGNNVLEWMGNVVAMLDVKEIEEALVLLALADGADGDRGARGVVVGVEHKGAKAAVTKER